MISSKVGAELSLKRQAPFLTILCPAIDAVQEVLVDPPKYRQEKTDKMNDQLNNLVPYFRCSDEDIVKVRGVNDILH